MTSRRVRRTAVAVLWLWAAALLLSGCGDDEPGADGGEMTPDQARERVVAATQEAARTLSGLGEVADVGGAWTVCASPPAEAVEYRASGLLAADEMDDPAAAIPEATTALTDAGWTLTDEGADPRPWANLELDGTTLSLRPDPRPDTRTGSERVSFAVADACVRVGDGESSDYDFAREPIEVD